uniref:Uncharacterized protein n=1 Tax=Guangdong chinese water snake torovirus TaxID=2116383 RepID=A0A2P1GNK8_9NIDO|nr:hypothetical protein [Guangdong chinese water snake torovirus]
MLLLLSAIVVVAVATSSTSVSTPTIAIIAPRQQVLQLNCSCVVGFCAVEKSTVVRVFGQIHENTSHYFYAQSIVVVFTNTSFDNICYNITLDKLQNNVYSIPIKDSCQLQIPGNFYLYRGDTPVFTSAGVELCEAKVNMDATLPVVDVNPVIQDFLNQQVHCQNFSYFAKAIAKGPGGGDIFIVSVSVMLVCMGMMIFWLCCRTPTKNIKTNKYY